MIASTSPPAPQVDAESAPFWAALREHRIVMQRCGACSRLRFPPMPGCPYCGAPGREQVEVSGTGTVYSFVRVHRALTAAMHDEVPYTVAVVQLDDGGARLIGRVDDDAGALSIGDAVLPSFVDHAGWTELRFRPAGAPGTGS